MSCPSGSSLHTGAIPLLHLLTRDWTAWVLLSHMSCLQGGKKVEEAFFIFQELGDKYSWTVSSRYSPIRGRRLSPCLAMHCCMCEHG